MDEPTTLPIVCDLSAEALATRRDALSTGVLKDAQSIEQIEDGLRWRFASRHGLIADLSSLIESERACCRFLTFHVRAEAGAGPVTLDVTGPPGTREFLQTWVSAGAR